MKRLKSKWGESDHDYTIQAIDNTIFQVTVEGHTTTTHRVTVNPGYYEKLTGKRIDVEELVRKSFDFLLERESNTSIFPSFDLPIISRYFPEMKTRFEAP
ncbi:MAG: hypothetical protein ACREYF_23205 [Gammaproteobacteria bacterium]